MAFSGITKDMNIIAALADEPNDVGGLSAAQLKAKFDEGGLAIKQYINTSLLAQLASSGAATQLGAKDADDNTTNIQAVLDSLIGAVLGQLPDGSVTAAKLHSDAVETAKIKDGAVTDAKVDWTTSGIARVEIKSYVGNGAVNPEPTVIAFTHLPKLVIITGSELSESAAKYASGLSPYGAVWAWDAVIAAASATVYKCVRTCFASSSGGGLVSQNYAYFTLSNGNKTISLLAPERYGGSYVAADQLNAENETYTVISFY